MFVPFCVTPFGYCALVSAVSPYPLDSTLWTVLRYFSLPSRILLSVALLYPVTFLVLSKLLHFTYHGVDFKFGGLVG